MLQVNRLSADTRTLLETLPTPKLDLTMHVLVYGKKTWVFCGNVPQQERKLKKTQPTQWTDARIWTRPHWWRPIVLFPIPNIAGNRVSDTDPSRTFILSKDKSNNYIFNKKKHRLNNWVLCLKSKILLVNKHVLSFIPGVVVGGGGVVVGGGGVPEKITNIQTNHTQAVSFVVNV